MMAKQQLPVTASVVDWAISASGESIAEIARAAGVDDGTIVAWRTGQSAPSVGELRKLAAKLHRPFAAFFLPKPPDEPSVSVDFRHPPGTPARKLNPRELRHIRRALRLQRVLGWLLRELGDVAVELPPGGLRDAPNEVASDVRVVLGVSVDEQATWLTSSVAFDRWREAIEAAGVLVFVFPLGNDACRGFSLWHEQAPIVAVNSAWNEEARIFTLLHELGHLVTRTDSACAEGVSQTVTPDAWDAAERWCERFASHVLMPDASVLSLVRSRGLRTVSTIGDARWIANRLKVSVRATVIKLIELQFANWDLYRQIPPTGDNKRQGGGGGGGRDRGEIRHDQLGKRAATLFDRGVRADIMTRAQALGYLDVGDSHFDAMVSAE